MKQSTLEARALIAGDLYKEGEITRTECFRLEMDAALGRDTGEIVFCKNNEYTEMLEDKKYWDRLKN